jgi:hypothetical protein
MRQGSNYDYDISPAPANPPVATLGDSEVGLIERCHMKRASLLLVAILALVCASRLPAPIQEIERPTPAPSAAPTAKPRSKPVTKTERAPKSATKNPFAGTWGGVGQYQRSDGNSGTYPYTIRVRDDAKTIGITSKDGAGAPWTEQVASYAEGAVLVARDENKKLTTTTTYRLKLNQDGTMLLFRLDKYKDGRTATVTATLIRQ